MRIEYFHASKYGNGAMVAEEFKKQMAAKGIAVNVHHIREAKPKEMPPADLYLFSSPGLSNFYFVGVWATAVGSLARNANSGKTIIRRLCKKDGKEFKAHPFLRSSFNP